MKKYKNLFLLYLTLQLISEFAFSQSYYAFPDSNAIWRQTDYWFDQTSLICRDYQLFIVGDTTINNIVYKNVYWSGTWGPNGWCNYQVFSTGEPVIGIREDLLKHIYLYDFNSSAEYLLYDFNLSVGDSLPDALPFNLWQAGTTITISQIDSVQIGSSYRKRYWCSTAYGSNCSPCINYVSIIEGIGSDYGLFADLSPNWAEKDFSLLCFKHNGLNIYPVGQPCSLVPVGMAEINPNANSIKIYPNPANSILNIQTSISKQLNLTLVDLSGKEIIRDILVGNFKLNQISLDELPNGIYGLKLSDGESIYANWKVVVIK